jgi:hypothetical protein
MSVSLINYLLLLPNGFVRIVGIATASAFTALHTFWCLHFPLAPFRATLHFIKRVFR